MTSPAQEADQTRPRWYRRVDAPAGETNPAHRSWHRRLDPVAIAGVVLLFVYLLPARMTAYRGDDTFTSEWTGQRLLTHESPWTQLTRNLTDFVHTGRPSVLGGVLGYVSSWELGNHRMGEKLVIVAFTVTAGWLLYRFVRCLGVSRGIGLVSVAVLATSFQFRMYHDGAIGYWGVGPLVMVFFFASLVLFLQWLQQGGRWRYVVSALLFTGCLLLYEAPYPLSVVFPVVALFERRGREAIKPALPFLVIAFAFVLYSYFGRQASDTDVAYYDVGGTVWAAIRVFIYQLFAPIPGSSLFFTADFANFLPLGTNPTKAELAGAAWRGLVAAAIVLGAAALAIRDHVALPTPQVQGRLAVVGLMIWVLPVTLISLAPKYQFEIVPGKGHIPAVMQVYGWALVIAALFCFLITAARRRSPLAAWLTAAGMAFLVAIGAAANGYINLRVAALEQPIVIQRDLAENAAQHGLLDSLPARSTILFNERDMKWPTGNLSQDFVGLEAMLRQRTGREYDGRLVPEAQTEPCPRTPVVFPPPDCSPTSRTSAWFMVRAKPGGGSAIVAPIATDGSFGGAYSAGSKFLYVYTETGHPPLLGGFNTKGRPWASTDIRWTKKTSGDGWSIWAAKTNPKSAPIAATLYDDRNSLDFRNLGPSGDIVRKFGTKRVLP